MTIKQADAKRGAETERHFQAWLDHSSVPYIYIEQSVVTVPKGLRRGGIKRPDFVVGFPNIGSIAFDVKSKSIYKDCFIFDEVEINSTANYEVFFNTTVWFAVFPPNSDECYLLLNSFLRAVKSVKGKDGKRVVYYPLKDCLKVNTDKTTLNAAVFEMNSLA